MKYFSVGDVFGRLTITYLHPCPHSSGGRTRLKTMSVEMALTKPKHTHQEINRPTWIKNIKRYEHTKS